ncbi:ABC transporter substrate-binding protein [Pseudoflavonifractor sp. MSJ-37]|uniref:ABC transporter substrate-binding protein n=1 Tax=Pseudoflavonifractor sp. MSJ-37 TaxID=2841531 RepID=UPI001C1282CD|nr:ABC transporter substrate-binding protein [Pseudoflavonifractor sp. MSJ-37]MBU5435457.1 ABC transporter substrate-binding protein [Pseudoflavonifractor sp. MSJ-37]
MNKLNKTAAILSTALTLSTVLAACGDSGSAGESTAPSASAAGASDVTAEENTIRFATQPGQIRTAINILADQLGYYEEEGVNVEFVNASSTEALTAITTNKKDVDVLGTGIVPDLTFIANGSDLVVFEGTAAEGGAIISRQDDVEKYKDLKNYAGTTAAMVRGSSSWVITRAKLVESGVDVDSIKLLEVDSQANVAQAVAKGEADLGFLPIEYANSTLDLGTALVYEVGELDPQYVCCRQVTSSQKLSEKHDAFVKYTVANLRAWEYYEDEANRPEIIKTLADFSGQTEDYVENYLFVNRTFLTLDPNEKGIETFYESLSDSGYFDGDAVDVDEHIDTDIYAEALQEVLDRDPDDAFFQDKLEVFRTYNNDVQI